MAITKEQAIDILDMMDFFQGQRAGRELWVAKPFEVQEQDISNFSKNVHLLKEYITSDVAPRAEVAREIFEEIDDLDIQLNNGDLDIKYFGSAIAELKKKYTA